MYCCQVPKGHLVNSTVMTKKTPRKCKLPNILYENMEIIGTNLIKITELPKNLIVISQ